jgi:predicted short-subunit dehydrogenase-like oxidoreductase (DUF2520 family)
MSLNFCFIGAGNLATRLSTALVKNGFSVIQVFSRTERSAKVLAEKVNSSYTISVKDIDKVADIYVVALTDGVVDTILSKIDIQNKLLIHCAGSMPLSILKKYSSNIGVLYPLQTFSRDREIDFENIPVFVEANTNENEEIILSVARKISTNVSILDSDKRQLLHVSAVFACNFVNYFYTIAADILESEDIPFEVLKPLVMETAQKAITMEPKYSQTGPAVRFDENVMKKHLDLLKNNKVYQELYMSVSKGIFDFHKKLE